ncbi:MAG TPA: hypothetical protein VFQ44_08525 [Streptosporangiaceae bacterium]|nr:hypothetical protein [Streptosporangiaceae bacterium]
MPGRTRAEARDGFLAPLRRALSCFTTAQLFVSRSHPSGSNLEALALSEDPLLLYSEHLTDAVQFQLRHQFQLVKVHEHSWHVSSVAYFYQLSDSNGTELVA